MSPNLHQPFPASKTAAGTSETTPEGVQPRRASLSRRAKNLVKAAIRHLPGKRGIFALLRVFKPPRSITKRLPVEGLFTVSIDGATSFRLIGHGLSTETELFWNGINGFEERRSLKCWTELCRRAAIILDVGAYLGIYALVAAAVNPRARVFGFEPVRRTFEMFRDNCALNGSRVKPIRAAVGDHDGVAKLFVDPKDPMSASVQKVSGHEEERVRMLALRTFFREERLDRLDAIKIDVETFEPAVLEGMGDLLFRFRPAMIVEVLNDEAGSSVERLCVPPYLYFHLDETRGPRRTEHLRRVRHESRNYLVCSDTCARSLGLA